MTTHSPTNSNVRPAEGQTAPITASATASRQSQRRRDVSHQRPSFRSSWLLTTGRVAALTGFICAAVAANTMTAHYGLSNVGFGLTATAGTWAAGLVLTLRDLVHDLWGRAAVYAAIFAAALASAGTAGPHLAVASGVAFAVSELADLVVYVPLRRRSWVAAVLASNTVGTAVDSLVFLTVARFTVATALPGQLFAKTTATLAVVVPVVAARALLRHRFRPPRP